MEVETIKQVKITRDKAYERYKLTCDFCDWQIQFRAYESAVNMRAKHLNSVKHFNNTRGQEVTE